MIASFSGWARSAAGLLNTRAPSRSACVNKWVQYRYSASKGGSLRISTASVRHRGRSVASISSYQACASPVSWMRRARAVTTPPRCHTNSCGSQAQISCPREAASRIIAKVLSLWVLKVSSGSATKSSFMVSQGALSATSAPSGRER